MMLSTALENSTAQYLPTGSNHYRRRERNGGAERRAVVSSEMMKHQRILDEKMRILVTALQETGHRQLWEVRPRLAGNALHLEGDVTCFYLKQLAQEAVRPYTVGMRIRNDLRVAQPSTSA